MLRITPNPIPSALRSLGMASTRLSLSTRTKSFVGRLFVIALRIPTTHRLHYSMRYCVQTPLGHARHGVPRTIFTASPMSYSFAGVKPLSTHLPTVFLRHSIPSVRVTSCSFRRMFWPSLRQPCTSASPQTQAMTTASDLKRHWSFSRSSLRAQHRRAGPELRPEHPSPISALSGRAGITAYGSTSNPYSEATLPNCQRGKARSEMTALHNS